MNLRLNNEFLYQIFALLLAVIVVHGVYVGVIRPTADAQLATQAALQPWPSLAATQHNSMRTRDGRAERGRTSGRSSNAWPTAA